MYLMNKDIPVLWFDNKEMTLVILNNDMLPFSLRDGIQSSDKMKTLPQAMKNYDKLRSFFASRVLSISRDNAKQILESIGNKQRLTTEECMALSLKCKGVSVCDNFWTKEDDEDICFEQVNIRKKSLSDITFQISIKGSPVSLQHEILSADISTNGMFRKTWRRVDGELWLYKSDRTASFVNTKAELESSKILDLSNVPHISYKKNILDGVFCCKCKCFTSDDISFADAEAVLDYCNNKGQTLVDFIRKKGLEKDFANMVVMDYLLANPDEHINNWGFLVDANTNEIKSIAPLYDNNQSLIAIWFEKENEFDELIYGPTGLTTKESAAIWFQKSDISFSEIPEIIKNRWEKLKELSREIIENECEKDL